MFNSSDFHPFGTQRTWPDGSSLHSGHSMTSSEMNGRTPIRDLSPNLPQCVVVGVVIGKEESRSFADKKNPGQTRCRMGFTVRDGPDDYINVTVWGSQSYLDKLSSSFKIYDVVEITNCQVQAKQSEEIEERFKPWTPGPYHLHLKELFSSVTQYSGNDFAEFMSLAHIPVREEEGFNNLGQLVDNPDDVQGQHVHFMAAVKHVGVGRKVVTKSGREVTRCEIKLFDETCSYFSMMLWDQETIHLAQGWAGGETVVLVIDARVSYDNYRKMLTATADAKTLIITNPDTHRGHYLFQFAQSTPIDCQDTGDGSSFSDDSFLQQRAVDLISIKELFTVETWRQAVCGLAGHQTCHGMMIAVLTHIGLSDAIAQKCSLCKRRVKDEKQICQNSDCAGFQHPTTVENSFDVLLVLSDHTGSMTCRITGPEAETLLACSSDEYFSMGESTIQELKWKLQLEWVKVYLQAFVSPTRTIPLVRVLCCSLADLSAMKLIQ